MLKKIAAVLLILALLCTGCASQTYKANVEKYDWFVDYLGLPEIWNNSITGKEVMVAVIDSGIDYNLLGEEFDSSRILAEFNAIDNSDDVIDDTYHGSAMVNLIGASGNNNLFGIAPDCKFVIIKALDSLGSTTSAILEKAIKFAVAFGVDVINLSIGGANENEGIIEAIQLAIDANIVVICSAGDYERECAIFPAKLDNCLGVAAIDCTGKLYSKSNFGVGVDAYFPGVKIKTTRYDYAGDVIYTERSGSSVATAIASGMVALYIGAVERYTVDEVYSIFKKTNCENLKSILMENKL